VSQPPLAPLGRGWPRSGRVRGGGAFPTSVSYLGKIDSGSGKEMLYIVAGAVAAASAAPGTARLRE